MSSKKFYLASFAGLLAGYSRLFYEQVLRDQGFECLDSAQPFPLIFSQVSSRDRVHIELGSGSAREAEICLTMLKANYRAVSVTWHDGAEIRHSSRRLQPAAIARLARWYDHRLAGRRGVKPYLERLHTVYVFSNAEAQRLTKNYGIRNVSILPAVYTEADLKTSR